MRLRIIDCGADFAETEIVVGGTLSNHKGVNVPQRGAADLGDDRKGPRRSRPSRSTHGADWIALSFVQRPDDVAEGRKLVGNAAGIMVKLEKPAAIGRLDEIIELADAVMVARGDLGVEMPPEDVPTVQKRLIHACRLAGKPVIVATQMLESMIGAPTPTRAEASDVATAVYEGADAVMLSAETAVGRYPVEAVAMMDRIACRVQQDPLYFATLDASRLPARAHQPRRDQRGRLPGRARRSAPRRSSPLPAPARPRCAPRASGPGADPGADPEPARRRGGWRCSGARIACTSPISGASTTWCRRRCAPRMPRRSPNRAQRVVITAGVPFGTPGATNVLRIAWVDR